MNKYNEAYILRAVSPMHVGSGTANYGIIDNLVQRDTITQRPIINSSSMKGALREFFNYHLKRTMPSKQKEIIKGIFGSEADVKNRGKGEKLEKGQFDFGFGYLLSMPVRCDKAPFVSITTPDILKEFIERLELYNVKKAEAIKQLLSEVLKIKEADLKSNPLIFRQEFDGVIMEDEDIQGKYQSLENLGDIEAILGSNLVMMSHENFAYLVDKLPVIARNQLENGESKNLWYEEVVPRESRFYTIITKVDKFKTNDTTDTTEKLVFDLTIQSKGHLVQIGANATVGYGRTQFTTLEKYLKA